MITFITARRCDLVNYYDFYLVSVVGFCERQFRSGQIVPVSAALNGLSCIMLNGCR